MRLSAYLIALSLLASPVSTNAAEAVAAFARVIGTSTTWISASGSVMTLDVSVDGVIGGYYVNNAPGIGCRGVPYDLRGRASDDGIAFRVSWRNGVADCGSATEWRGQVRAAPDGGLEIVTEWQSLPSGGPVLAAERGVDRFVQHLPGTLQTLLGR